ncbi:VOC family protein [Piscinibacter sp.]|uniref:VOC family protein n=1 Tax=Piscinibacter sp. TaxID=1903157 RepID=UPI0039E6BC89
MSTVTPAPRQRFPDGISEGLSHGTLELRNIPATRTFFREFLGLRTLRHAVPAFKAWHDHAGFFIACIEIGALPRQQTRDNRWEVAVANAAEVERAHRTALRLKDEQGLLQVDPLQEQDGFPWFCLQDMDGNWWGISNRDSAWMHAAFDAAFGKEVAA